MSVVKSNNTGANMITMLSALGIMAIGACLVWDGITVWQALGVLIFVTCGWLFFAAALSTLFSEYFKAREQAKAAGMMLFQDFVWKKEAEDASAQKLR